eukprot:CAMPEP_0202706720 /NCGR_PEP_ID=MMETSP1385-20130828/19093_1 /ASSEMBLY_ACC=CAM_ASM_000861 /TAXON_ID=933848 /ORGANISM="Elphidium margaritaceum" /LENGTH=668 /DNA_ID=CAMNT_0049365251 /DNA_START=32 /DNA_END=2038 /DNA_ORIENTATION=-
MSDELPLHESSINATWLVLASSLAFIMQIGFMAVETGSVGRIWRPGTIVKNFEDLFLGIVSFSIVGYSFAFDGDSGLKGFMGGFKYAFLRNVTSDEWLFVVFQMCFVSTAATIVSGCVVERMTSGSYAMFSFLLSSIVYPVLVHWVWASDGWLLKLGFVDFAGSGVVHVTGGMAGLVLLQFLGERVAKGSGIKGLDHNQQDLFLVGTGVFLLWLGWIGFNCGAVIVMVRPSTPETVGLIAVNIVLSACVAAATSNIYLRFVVQNFNLTQSLNCLLCGLVAITSSCHNIQPWAAYVIGVQAVIGYFMWEKLLSKLDIDDPLSVTSVHLMGGALGVINQALFADTGDASTSGLFISGAIKPFGIQCLGLLVICVWVAVWVCIFAKFLDKCMGIRASLFVEDQGVKLWEYVPELAFKLLLPSLKHDAAARMWLWSFRDFVMKVYPNQAQSLDALVVIHEFRKKCEDIMAGVPNLTGDFDGTGNDLAMTEAKETLDNLVSTIFHQYKKIKQNCNDDDRDNESVLSRLRAPSPPNAADDRLSRNITMLESNEGDLMDYYRQKSNHSVMSSNNIRNIRTLMGMRYVTLFDAVRDDAMRNLQTAWNIFAKRGLPEDHLQLAPDKVYSIDESDFSITWLSEYQLVSQKQKSIYLIQKIVSLESPTSSRNRHLPKEE